MTEFILIRHGETDWNKALCFQGHIDVELNKAGQDQAQRIADRLANEPADALICSDLLRAQQTAKVIKQASKLPWARNFVVTAGLREQDFGVVDGLTVENIQQKYPDSWSEWVKHDENYCFERGESTVNFHLRVMKAMEHLAQTYPNKTLVVVTHGGVLDMIYRSANGLSLSGPRRTDIPNAGLSRVHSSHFGLKILEWGQTQHLAGLPPQVVYPKLNLS